MGHDTNKRWKVLYTHFCNFHDNLSTCKASRAQRVYITYSRSCKILSQRAGHQIDTWQTSKLMPLTVIIAYTHRRAYYVPGFMLIILSILSHVSLQQSYEIATMITNIFEMKELRLREINCLSKVAQRSEIQIHMPELWNSALFPGPLTYNRGKHIKSQHPN